MSHERFHYKSLAEVKEKASELGVSLPFAEDTTILAQPLKVRDITFPNRLGIAPMEGADSTPAGAPSDYTIRRYVNEAIGGSSARHTRQAARSNTVAMSLSFLGGQKEARMVSYKVRKAWAVASSRCLTRAWAL